MERAIAKWFGPIPPKYPPDPYRHSDPNDRAVKAIAEEFVLRHSFRRPFDDKICSDCRMIVPPRIRKENIEKKHAQWFEQESREVKELKERLNSSEN